MPKLLDFGIAKLLLCAGAAGGRRRPHADGHICDDAGLCFAGNRSWRIRLHRFGRVLARSAVLYELLAGQRPHTLTRYDAVGVAAQDLREVRSEAAFGRGRSRVARGSSTPSS